MVTQTHQPKKVNTWAIVIGILVIILLVAWPLLTIRDSEFGGADGLGAKTVQTLAPDYNSAWITNWWEPPSGEIESALFALQAAIGGLLIGYGFGFLHGRAKGRAQAQSATPDES